MMKKKFFIMYTVDWSTLFDGTWKSSGAGSICSGFAALGVYVLGVHI